MRIEVSGQLLICDCCGSQHLIRDDDPAPELPQGVHGKITTIDGGGNSYEFYSCQTAESHVIQAMRRAEQLSLANPDDYEKIKENPLS